jgi:aminoglycoside 3-N-acetyltransferase
LNQQTEKPYVTQSMIEAGFKELGIKEGDIVIAHSSLKSFGYVEGGADSVIDAFLNIVGSSGTACVPTLTYGPYSPENPPPPFDPHKNPCIVGTIPETFRKRHEAIRSLHPTHSIACIGAKAKELTEGHEYSETPIGPKSPWGKIADHHGYVLMIGCGTGPLTMSHGAEEVVHNKVRCTPPVLCKILKDNKWIEVSLRLHGPYERPGPGRIEMEAILESEGYLRRAKVGNSTLLLIDARGVWDVATKICQEYEGRIPK